MFTVSLKLRLKQFSFPTLNFTRIHQKAILFVLQGFLVWYKFNMIEYLPIVLVHCLFGASVSRNGQPQ